MENSPQGKNSYSTPTPLHPYYVLYTLPSSPPIPPIPQRTPPWTTKKLERETQGRLPCGRATLYVNPAANWSTLHQIQCHPLRKCVVITE